MIPGPDSVRTLLRSTRQRDRHPVNVPDRETQVVAELERRRRDAIRRTFTRLDPVALGAGLGVVAAIVGWVLPGRLLFGNPPADIQDIVGRLTHFLPGFDITTRGALIGAAWFLIVGFAAGFLVASFRNLALRIVLWRMNGEAARWRRRHFLDEI
jgi:hypothetical protein